MLILVHYYSSIFIHPHPSLMYITRILNKQMMLNLNIRKLTETWTKGTEL